MTSNAVIARETINVSGSNGTGSLLHKELEINIFWCNKYMVQCFLYYEEICLETLLLYINIYIHLHSHSIQILHAAVARGMPHN